VNFLLALQFLTILPVRIRGRFDGSNLGRSMPYFPLVGIVIGSILAGLQCLLIRMVPGPVANVILILALLVVTGGLHVDGLADTADALFSGKSREEKLRIMRQGTIGPLGAATVALVLYLKVALLNSIHPAALLPALVLAPAVGRCGILLPASLFRYARQGPGTGRAYVGTARWMPVGLAVIATAALCAVVLGWMGLGALVSALALAVAAGKWIETKIGGMTGDTLGAINELGEVVFWGFLCLRV
jgi:adenosylcobinamide-GDP ribazoletransferase